MSYCSLYPYFSFSLWSKEGTYREPGKEMTKPEKVGSFAILLVKIPPACLCGASVVWEPDALTQSSRLYTAWKLIAQSFLIDSKVLLNTGLYLSIHTSHYTKYSSAELKNK